MIQLPPGLKKGDKIAIVCPAKKLKKPIDNALDILRGWGLEIVEGKSVQSGYHQFAGDDQLRTADLQQYLDDPEIKGIIAGRGGYGTLRIIDNLDFTNFLAHPKWVVGFSDITVLLSHILAQTNTASIHGQMPGTFEDASRESLESLRRALFNEGNTYDYSSSFPNRTGIAEGILAGGNLSILIALEGSVSAIDYKDKILFLEDVGEPEYSIDRMLRILIRSGKLNDLKGLIIGAFNEIPEESIPFGQTPEEIIQELVKDYHFPVCYNFPCGHIADNRAMIVGKTCRLKVDGQEVSLIM